ncbi:MAG: hypothetical protein K2J77_00245 [Oscillospiraceae bacterium]|nr:hypothetical protein [Oscillospiraceae bacterium]
MKKILAGVLAAASMLAVSATAFATTSDKTVTKAGELTYDVAVTAPKIVLNLVMPAKMTAALNPYGAEIKIDATDASKVVTNGIASTMYTVTNKTEDYGVYIDATAVTTITTSDKDASGKPAWSVKGNTVTAGTKGAALALMASKAAPTITSKAITLPTTTASWASNAGALLMDSTVAADTTNKTPAGYTTVKKLAYVAASDSGTDGTCYLTFVGLLAGEDTNKPVEWKEDDAINVNLVLKVSAGPKTLT